MKLTFKMTPEEYYLGWKYRMKKWSKFDMNKIVLILSLVLVILFIILRVDVYFIICILLLMAGIMLSLSAQKKSVMRSYAYSTVNNGEQTVRIYDEGIELFNSYEKMFTPWQSVYAVQETPQYIKILPGYSAGMAVISKSRYASAELDGIVGAIKSHINVEEGKK